MVHKKRPIITSTFAFYSDSPLMKGRVLCLGTMHSIPKNGGKIVELFAPILHSVGIFTPVVVLRQLHRISILPFFFALHPDLTASTVCTELHNLYCQLASQEKKTFVRQKDLN